MTLDFARLADGVKRANVDLMGITFQASAEIRDGGIVLQPTGQRFPLAGPAPSDVSASRRTMKVLDWLDPSKTRVEIVK